MGSNTYSTEQNHLSTGPLSPSEEPSLVLETSAPDPGTQTGEADASRGKRESKGIRMAAILLAMPLICINSLWLFANWGKAGYASGQSFATVISLFYNVIFCQVVLMIANFFLRRYMPLLALRNSELIVIYILMTIGSAMASHDTTQILWPMIAYPTWFGTSENGWTSFQHAMPDALTVQNKEALKDYFMGGTTLYTWEHISIWLKPVLIWTGIIGILTIMMLFMVALLTDRWTRQERLSCPIVQMPLAMMQDEGGFFKNKLMWLGLILTAIMSTMNGLHQLFPAIPGGGGTFVDLGSLITTRPWSAIGYMPIAISPFGIGMSFFIPLDLSFSMWFFYLAHKFSLVFGDIVGFKSNPRYPYPNEQAGGAWLGLAAVVLWSGRSAIKEQFAAALYGGSKSQNAIMSPRTAFMGLAVGSLLLISLAKLIGISPVLSIVYLMIFFAICITITRIRAELGPPSHDLMADPPMIITAFHGTRGLGAPTLTMLTLMNSLNRAYRAHPMPNMMEGFVMTSRRGITDTRKLLIGIVLAVFIGTLSSAWAHYFLSYKWGAANYGEQYQHWWFFDKLTVWVRSPKGPDWPGVGAILSGAGLTFLLMAIRHWLPLSPFHPAGYALSLSPWNSTWFAASIFLGWLVKFVIMRYGGLRLYKVAMPFFMGMVLGDLLMAAFWSLLGISMGMPMYRFLS